MELDGFGGRGVGGDERMTCELDPGTCIVIGVGDEGEAAALGLSCCVSCGSGCMVCCAACE